MLFLMVRCKDALGSCLSDFSAAMIEHDKGNGWKPSFIWTYSFSEGSKSAMVETASQQAGMMAGPAN